MVSIEAGFESPLEYSSPLVPEPKPLNVDYLQDQLEGRTLYRPADLGVTRIG